MATPQFRVDRPAPVQTPVPLLDVNRENQALEKELMAALQTVCRSGRFIMGPDCEQLEQRLAELTSARHAIGCASGSDALLLALMAMDLQPGDEVIVPSFTFFATASAVWRLGGVPVFVDIDPETYNVSAQQVAAAVTDRTRAIIPVHLFGQSADMDAMLEIANRHHLTIIEDAAQAIGAAWRGRPVGSWGQMACFSFYPTKNLGGFGDGGLVTTNDDRFAERLKLLRAHGMQPRYYHHEVGINSRLDTLQAAVLNVKLSHLDSWTAARQANARRYADSLGAMRHLAGAIELPRAAAGATHVWNQYTIRVLHGRRDALRTHLSQLGIGTEIYYPVPLHQQVCFQSLGTPRHVMSETVRAAAEVLSLPIFPTMTEAEQRAVIAAIDGYFAQAIPQPHLSAGAIRHRAG